MVSEQWGQKVVILKCDAIIDYNPVWRFLFIQNHCYEVYRYMQANTHTVNHKTEVVSQDAEAYNKPKEFFFPKENV